MKLGSDLLLYPLSNTCYAVVQAHTCGLAEQLQQSFSINTMPFPVLPKLKSGQQHHTGEFRIHTTLAFAWRIEENNEKLQLGYLVFQPGFKLRSSKMTEC